MTIESLVHLWCTIASTFKNYSVKSGDTLITRLPSTPNLLTHVLPALGKAVDTSLSTGFIEIPHGLFRLCKGRKTPVFLKEYFNHLYDKDGYLFSFASTDLIRELRTLLYMFYKLELDFTPQQEGDAILKFLATDDSVKTEFTDEQINAISGIFQGLFPKDPFDIKPHHSSGATADHVDNVMKIHTVRHIPKLNRVYGLQYFFNTREHAKRAHDAGQLSTATPTARVAFVPKDSRGPRTICMEPHEIMFIQKGLQTKIYECIETPGHPAYKRINFTDQKINQRLAYLGSLDGSLATIDMKDASDLVSWDLIKRICNDDWLVALDATRSAFVTLPNGMTRELKKFAPMGSALCFPIEAMLFYSIARTITDKVWVYGDDIIVPNEVSHQVMALLESYGLVVNRDKSLTTGFFRESCGGDFFRGANITPIRFKNTNLASVVAYANNMATAFTSETGEAIVRWFESLNPVTILRLPNSNKDCPLLAFRGGRDNSFLFKRRWNADLQFYEFRGLAIVTKPRKKRLIASPASEYNELFYWFTSAEHTTSPLERDETNMLLEAADSYQVYRPSFDGSRHTRIKLSKKQTCYIWAPIERSMLP